MSVPTEEIVEQPVEATVDGAKLEADLLAEKRKQQAEMDPVEIAARMLTVYTPRFNMLVDKLSSRQLKRVTKSIVEFPLGKTYRHTDELEKEVFAIGNALLDAKYVMIAQTYSDNRERILNEAAKAASNEEGKEDGKEETQETSSGISSEV
jgi:hypothetical protein